MRITVFVAASDGFLAVALRQLLRAAPGVVLAGEARDGQAALAALSDRSLDAVVVERALLAGANGEPLAAALRRRTAPTVIVDPLGTKPVPFETVGPMAVLAPAEPAPSANFGVIAAGLLPSLQRLVEDWRLAGARLGEKAAPRSATPPVLASGRRRPELVLIGASTGGPTALAVVLKGVQRPSMPVVIAQHMPPGQTASFAQHLAEVTGLTVVERGGGPLPADGSVTVLRAGDDYRLRRMEQEGLALRRTRLADTPFHPSVDALLLSAAEAGLAAGAVIMTGMGCDGAAGARALAGQGVPVLVQTPESCAVSGMPEAAISAGAATEVLGPEAIAARINGWMRQRESVAIPEGGAS